MFGYRVSGIGADRASRLSLVEKRYRDGTYLAENPDWDRDDSTWKADRVRQVLKDHGIEPRSVCEIGCGAGDVLSELRRWMPDARLYGYDISSQASAFWDDHRDKRIEFRVGDFFELDDTQYDLVLVLDVLEHVSDPFVFLQRLRGRGEHYLFHFPLDLSAISVLRESPLLHVRRKVGHLHYFTKKLVLSLLEETGFAVRDCRYTGAAFSAPQRGIRTRLASVPRRIAYAIDKDFGVRLLGGETLLVLAQDAAD